jgi:hypothetical protein
MLIIEPDAFYVCAGICRIDPETSTCVGCGRPVAELAQRTDATGDAKPLQRPTGADPGDGES